MFMLVQLVNFNFSECLMLHFSTYVTFGLLPGEPENKKDDNISTFTLISMINHFPITETPTTEQPSSYSHCGPDLAALLSFCV